jgi:hypothetical protein
MAIAPASITYFAAASDTLTSIAQTPIPIKLLHHSATIHGKTKAPLWLAEYQKCTDYRAIKLLPSLPFNSRSRPALPHRVQRRYRH